MAKKHQHEEHLNHEAWAIPYGDLVTLLLAFFVVMYSISSVNEGKYRAAADSLSAAFGGAPRTIRPVQLGTTQMRGSDHDRPAAVSVGGKRGPSAPQLVSIPMPLQGHDQVQPPTGAAAAPPAAGGDARGAGMGATQLKELGSRLEAALADMVAAGLVSIRRGPGYLEVEIQSDLLFESGAAMPTPAALSTVRRLASVLRNVPNAVRVEGYTDNQPIHTPLFRSNWDLSVARATSVLHELVATGIVPRRLAAMGYGEYQPVADNASVAGRNANRRVELVILAMPQAVDAVPDPNRFVTGSGQPNALRGATAPQPAPPPNNAHSSDALSGTGGASQSTGAP